MNLSDIISANVATALAEDVGDGDLTAQLITAGHRGTATVISRQAAVLCGTLWFSECFRQVDPSVEIFWLAKEGDYTLDTNVETLAQLLDHLDQPSASIIGSSLGGSTAMAFAARHPGRVEKLVLNDIGPYMPAERRQRRAQAVAHHYIFKRPSDLFRRLGASAKNDGPVTEDELLHNTYFQTQWSAEHGGRVYRHDPRALQAYAADATGSIDQWDDWRTLDVPILVIHGLLSDALLLETVQQMLEKPGVVAMHVPETGHTPALSDAYQIHFVRAWLLGHGPDAPFTCLLPPATPRHLFTSAKPAA